METMIWQSELFLKFPKIIHGSTSKSYGILRYGDAVNHDQVLADRVVLVESLGVDPLKCHLVNQVHDKTVYKLIDNEPGTLDLGDNQLPRADALITSRLNQALIVRTADCVPIFFYAPKEGVVAVAHAGWQGTSKKIAQEIIKCFNTEYDIDSKSIICAIGPSICGACYDVSTTKDGRIELFDELARSNSAIVRRLNKTITLDLPLANQTLLLEMGVRPENIELSGICTFEQNDDWASYRKNPKDLSQQIWSVISLNENILLQ